MEERTQELGRSEERLRGAIGSLREGFVLYDADDKLTDISQITPSS